MKPLLEQLNGLDALVGQPEFGDDLVGVLWIRCVDDEVPYDALLIGRHDVDRSDVAADTVDRGGQLSEQIGVAGLELNADGDAVLGARGCPRRHIYSSWRIGRRSIAGALW